MVDKEMKRITKRPIKNGKLKDLQNEFENYKQKNDVKVSVVNDLRIENKRLLEALKFYGEKKNYQLNPIGHGYHTPNVMADGGNKARQVLEAVE